MSERYTTYAHQSIGTVKHSVRAQRDTNGWTLTLVAYPVQPVMPPDDQAMTSAEFFAFLRDQDVEVASRRAPLRSIGGVELRPADAAYALAQDVLGTAWTVLDKGLGFLVEIA